MLRFNLDEISQKDDIRGYLITRADVEFSSGLVTLYTQATTGSKYARTQEFIQSLGSEARDFEFKLELDHPTEGHKTKYHPSNEFLPGLYDNHIHLDFSGHVESNEFLSFFNNFLEKLSTSGDVLHPDLHEALKVRNPKYRAIEESRPCYADLAEDFSSFALFNSDDEDMNIMDFSSPECSPRKQNDQSSFVEATSNEKGVYFSGRNMRGKENIFSQNILNLPVLRRQERLQDNNIKRKLYN